MNWALRGTYQRIGSIVDAMTKMYRNCLRRTIRNMDWELVDASSLCHREAVTAVIAINVL